VSFAHSPAIAARALGGEKADAAMKTTEGPEESDRGTPRDYTESMYRFYLELADRS